VERTETTRDSAYGSRVTGAYFFTIISSPNGLVYIPVNSLIEMILTFSLYYRFKIPIGFMYRCFTKELFLYKK